MKHVTFVKDMRPYRPGEMRLVPDDVAARLVAEGAVKPDPPSWPEGSAPDPVPAALAEMKPPVRAGRRPMQSYLTK